MDRFFRQRGTALAEVSVLDRLAFLGTRTMGALTYHPPSDPAERPPGWLDLDVLASASQDVIAGSAKEVLPELLRAGGSPGGARPKVLIGVRGDEILSGEDDLPEGYRHWIVKFHVKEDPPDTGALELAFALMAKAAGITMPPARLFETARGERFFGVERFDRRGNHRYHVHTFGNLIHANFRIPSCDYRQLLEVTRILTRSHQDVLECYRRMVFNVLAHNRDDHVKNFAFRMTDDGSWELAPAYDLTFSPGPGGEHTMTVAGEGRAPARGHLLQLAGPVGISDREAEVVIAEVAAAVRRWPVFAAVAVLSASYLAAEYTHPEWAAAFARDPARCHPSFPGVLAPNGFAGTFTPPRPQLRAGRAMNPEPGADAAVAIFAVAGEAGVDRSRLGSGGCEEQGENEGERGHAGHPPVGAASSLVLVDGFEGRQRVFEPLPT